MIRPIDHRSWSFCPSKHVPRPPSTAVVADAESLLRQDGRTVATARGWSPPNCLHGTTLHRVGTYAGLGPYLHAAGHSSWLGTAARARLARPVAVTPATGVSRTSRLSSGTSGLHSRPRAYGAQAWERHLSPRPALHIGPPPRGQDRVRGLVHWPPVCPRPSPARVPDRRRGENRSLTRRSR